MKGRPFDAVFLDAGGVLVTPDPARVVAAFAAHGHQVDPARLFAAHYHGMLAVDRAEADPEVFDDYHHAYARRLGLPEEAVAAAPALLEALWDEGRLWVEPLPWAADALAALAATGLPLVVVSNADGTVAELLGHHGLLQVGPGPGVTVAGIVDSGLVGVAKPDPRIFELACDLVGVEPHRVLHVGDAYQYDVRGARAAGIHPVLVDPLDLRPEADCERVSSLTEVLALLT